MRYDLMSASEQDWHVSSSYLTLEPWRSLGKAQARIKRRPCTQSVVNGERESVRYSSVSHRSKQRVR